MTQRQSTIQKLDTGLEAIDALGLPVNPAILAKISGLNKRTATRFLQSQPSQSAPKLGNIYRDTIICTQTTVHLDGNPLRGAGFKTLENLSVSGFLGMVSVLIAGIARREGDLPNVVRSDQMLNFGSDYLDVYLRVVSAEEKSKGVYSRFTPLRNVQRENSFYKWFIKHDGYEAHYKSLTYSVTPYGHAIWRTALTLFSQLDFPRCDKQYNFSLALSDLPNIKPEDVKQILNNAVGIADGRILLKDNVRPSEADINGLTRMYGQCSFISSETRLKCGLIGYDVSACFQVIARAKCLKTIDSPEHDLFIADPAAYRQKIAKAEKKEYSETKTQITKITFGGGNDYVSLIDYANEEKIISNSVLSMAMLADDGRYDDAVELSKKHKDSTYLFHLLAMDEKLVRDAMSSCFKQYPMQVHDAVYSYEDIPVETLEAAVKEQTGFSVTIKKER